MRIGHRQDMDLLRIMGKPALRLSNCNVGTVFASVCLQARAESQRDNSFQTCPSIEKAWLWKRTGQSRFCSRSVPVVIVQTDPALITMATFRIPSTKELGPARPRVYHYAQPILSINLVGHFHCL